MRVQIDEALFEHLPRYGRDLDEIIHTVDRGQHVWVIADLDRMLATSWMCDRASWDRLDELAEKSWRAAIDEPSSVGNRRLVFVTDTPDNVPVARGPVSSEPPARAREILGSPAYLVLENATSDWHFVQAIVRTFSRGSLRTAIANRWLVEEQAGGSGEFEKRVAALVKRGIPPWRIAVLMDSDRLAPGPLPENVAARKARLERSGATVIALHKREAENYLPVSLLDGGARAVLVSFLHLDPRQRDHYDMKYGFGRDPKTQKAAVPDQQRDLFQGVSPWHLDRLIGGFGRDLGDRFAGATLDRDELAQTCVTRPGELEGMLDALAELL